MLDGVGSKLASALFHFHSFWISKITKHSSPYSDQFIVCNQHKNNPFIWCEKGWSQQKLQREQKVAC